MKIEALKQAKSSDNYFPWTTTDMNFSLHHQKHDQLEENIFKCSKLSHRKSEHVDVVLFGWSQPSARAATRCKQRWFLWKFHNFYFKAVISSCASLKSVRWKFFILHTLNFMARCWLNGMTDSLQTKTNIKNILYSHRVPNLTKFPLMWALETGKISYV